MSGQVIQLPEGCRGFDANCAIDAEGARAWFALGFRFVVRYVRREQRHDYDLTRPEIQALHDAGLAVGIAQHVAPEGWHPTAIKGSVYGNVAVESCHALEVPTGITIWCDLEGVAIDAPAADVVSYMQEWFKSVRPAGLQPGAYIGWHCGLTNEALYHQLSYQHYWKAYNGDATPSIRGFQMRQHELPNAGRPTGYHDLDGIDANIVERDNLGGLPTVWAPSGWAP